MTESEIIADVEERIRARLAGIRIRGAGAVTVTGENGSFLVSLTKADTLQSPLTAAKIDTGPTFHQDFTSANNNGFANVQLNFGGFVNSIPWTYQGQAIDHYPHPKVSTAGGIKFYAQLTFAVSCATFGVRDPDPDTDPPITLSMLSSVECVSATIIAVNRGTFPSHPDADAFTGDNPGEFTIQAELAQYNGDGAEDPPYRTDPFDSDAYDAWVAAEVTGNLFQSAQYGWNAQNTPYQLGGFTLIDVLTLAR